MTSTTKSFMQGRVVVRHKVRDFLAGTGMRTAYLPRIPGNQGDVLIERGLHQELDQLGIQQARRPERADWIVLVGGGAMNDFWKSGLEILKTMLAKYPSKPVAVMPSSFHFTKTRFETFFRDRRAPSVLFVRERYSLDLLKSLSLPAGVEVDIDHDMALCLSESEWVKKLRKIRETHLGDYILVVERGDAERPGREEAFSSGVSYRLDPPWIEWGKGVVRPIRRKYKRWSWRRREKTNPSRVSDVFHEETRRVLRSQAPELADHRWIEGDVSHALKYSFQEFIELTVRAAAVVTTRLHVGLLAAMVGAPTFLRTGGYWKIRGVWEYSLQDFPNVSLFGPDNPDLDDRPLVPSIADEEFLGEGKQARPSGSSC